MRIYFRLLFKFILITYCVILFTTCINDYYIPKNNGKLVQSQYEEYKGILLKSYENKSYYDIAIQLANMQGRNDKIFKYLNKSILVDISNCQRLYQMQYLADQNFFQNLYKIDTTLFKISFQICLQKLGLHSYYDYVMNQKELETQFNKTKPKIDSNKIRLDMIIILQEIHNADQKYRVKLADFRLSDTERKEFWSKQLLLDSINLLKVDSLLENNKYPTPDEVGFDLSQVIFFVLHHQTDIKIREGYYDKLKSYISYEQGVLFNSRTIALKNNSH